MLPELPSSALAMDFNLEGFGDLSNIFDSQVA